jgi:outer membrane immunogenic protein
MKKVLLGIVGLAAASMIAPANAADLAARPYTKAPPPMVAAVYDWTGFYLGLNGGGGWAHKCWDITNSGGALVAPAFREGCHDASGGMIGGQLGYRWQAANWVFGLEAQGDWADFKGSNISLFNPAVTNQTKIDAFGLFTGQVGYAWNNFLWYVKGGAAVANDSYRGLTTVGLLGVDTASQTRWGGTVGTGLEFGFAPNWSVAVEYDHIFMGNQTVNFRAIGTNLFDRTDTIKQDVDMATVRVNYRWGGPIISKY